MSSSNIPSSGGQTYTITANGTTYTTTAVPGGLGSFTVCADGVSGAPLATPAIAPMTLSAVSEEPVITFEERQPGGEVVKAVLEPDATLTARDLLKITTLISVLQHGVRVKPITYIRKHSLERHFRFSAV